MLNLGRSVSQTRRFIDKMCAFASLNEEQVRPALHTSVLSLSLSLSLCLSFSLRFCLFVKLAISLGELSLSLSLSLSPPLFSLPLVKLECSTSGDREI